MTNKDREEAVRHFVEKYRDASTGALRDALVECAMNGYDYAVSQMSLDYDE